MSVPACRGLVPRLDVHAPAVDGWCEVWWNGSLIGDVRKLGPKWRARLAGGSVFPVAYDSRKAAGERLRKTAESRRAEQ